MKSEKQMTPSDKGKPLARTSFSPSLILDKYIDREVMRECFGFETKDIARELFSAHSKALSDAVAEAYERSALIADAEDPTGFTGKEIRKLAEEARRG